MAATIGVVDEARCLRRSGSDQSFRVLRFNGNI